MTSSIAEQRRLALFPADGAIPEHARAYGVQVRLSELRRRRQRQWGACWDKLDEFWSARLPGSCEGTSWYHDSASRVDKERAIRC